MICTIKCEHWYENYAHFFATVETLVWFNEADKKHFQKISTYASVLTNIQRLYQRDKTKTPKK